MSKVETFSSKGRLDKFRGAGVSLDGLDLDPSAILDVPVAQIRDSRGEGVDVVLKLDSQKGLTIDAIKGAS